MKVLMKQISLIYFRVCLEVYVIKNPMCFSHWSVSDEEIWKIIELMKSFYISQEYSDMLYRGGAHYTSNPVTDIIKNEAEYKRINEKVIPEIMKELYKILAV